MVFHWSFALRLRSRIATRSHFIAVRLSGLITAVHKRTHSIVLSDLSGDWRFIAFPFSSVPFTVNKREVVRVRTVGAGSIFDCPPWRRSTTARVLALAPWRPTLSGRKSVGISIFTYRIFRLRRTTEAFITTLLRATRTLIAMNRQMRGREKPGATLRIACLLHSW
jgi:hypothetical protein